MPSDITPEQLREWLTYDAQSGVFRWNKKPARKIVVGSVASNMSGDGYVRIGLLGSRYRAHRLVWLYVYGRWPNVEIDHINNDRADNRLINLRECTRAQNMLNRRLHKNNTSGFRGVVRDHRTGKWLAQATLGYKTHYLGEFEAIEDAARRHEQFVAEHHGDFYCKEHAQ